MKKFSKHLTALLLIGASLVTMSALSASPASAAPKPTVTISGNAYAFLLAGYTDKLQGATIGIAEIPGLTTTAGPDGAYSLTVPNRRSITPYATMPGYHKIYDQTFFTSDTNLEQVNFQMPADPIYAAFAQLVGAKIDPDTGSTTQCAIVTTASQLKARNFPTFDDFWNYHPHGVPGTTATGKDELGIPLPSTLYFNDAVIPDPTQTATTTDGGALWINVPDGVYTVKGKNPDHRFGQFQATCKPGRLVNANPPWGLYELSRDEVTNPATRLDQKVDAKVTFGGITRRGNKRRLRIGVSANESVKVSWTLFQKYPVDKATKGYFNPGAFNVKKAISRKVAGGAAQLEVDLRDRSGNESTTGMRVWIPKRVKK